MSKQKSAYDMMKDNIKRNAHVRIEAVAPPKSSSMVEVEMLGRKLTNKVERILGNHNRCAMSK